MPNREAGRASRWGAQLLLVAGVLLVSLSSAAAQRPRTRGPQQATPRTFQQASPASATAGLQAVISGLTPTILTTYSWDVSVTADRPSVSVAVAAGNNAFGQVVYTVDFTRTRARQASYNLTGALTLTDLSGRGAVIQLPTVLASAKGGGVFAFPASGVSCPSLAVPAGGSLRCTFTGGYASSEPQPGTVTASVTVPGTLLPFSVAAAGVPYDFSGAPSLAVGGTASVSNYFESGPGLMQPYGVSGEQPPPGMLLGDSRAFRYTAFFGNIAATQCSTPAWQVVNTAELTARDGVGATAPLAGPTDSDDATVSLQLVGCGSAAPAFAGVQQPAVAQPVAPAPVVPAAPAPAAPVPRTAAPSGITFASAGSTLCGSNVCAANERCFDGFNCCPATTQVCGGVCCDGGRVCLENRCVAAGSSICGSQVCAAGQVCTAGVCCGATQVVCGTACCAAGQECINGVCANAGSVACGTSVCPPGGLCVSGTCCAAGETSCGGRCCGGGNICLSAQFCVPAGSSLCGASVCQAPQTCAGGTICCDPGATFCSGSCCPSPNSCQSGRCLALGQTLCGTNVCSSGQTCQGNQVCCNAGETFCNTGCCAANNVCVNNQCVPTGSTACGPTTVCSPFQFCGNTLTGTCCQSTNQVACGNRCCPQDQMCNWNQQCVPRFGGGACGAGEFWCPNASRCCPAGTRCAVGGCVPWVG